MMSREVEINVVIPLISHGTIGVIKKSIAKQKSQEKTTPVFSGRFMPFKPVTDGRRGKRV